MFIVFSFLISLNIFLTPPAIATPNAYEEEFHSLLNKVRSDFRTRNVNSEISRLEDLVELGQININYYGLGKGLFSYWRSVTSDYALSQIQNSCKQNGELKTILKSEFNRSKNLSYHLNPNINVSVIDLDYVQEIFQILYGHDNEIVFSEYGNACESRAHKMSELMDQMCIEVGKVFIQSGKVQLKNHKFWWNYHVAPFVYVRNGETLTPYVFDPSIFKKAVPMLVWIDKLRESHLDNEYKISLTNKYTILPQDITYNLQEFKKDDLDTVEFRMMLRKALRVVRPFLTPLKDYSRD